MPIKVHGSILSSFLLYNGQKWYNFLLSFLCAFFSTKNFPIKFRKKSLFFLLWIYWNYYVHKKFIGHSPKRNFEREFLKSNEIQSFSMIFCCFKSLGNLITEALNIIKELKWSSGMLNWFLHCGFSIFCNFLFTIRWEDKKWKEMQLTFPSIKTAIP